VDVYLDASVIVALLTNDLLTGRARTFLQTGSLTLFVNDYAAVEVASVIARRVRTRELTEAEA
jgi:predicted nucleic acid-binding protein